MDPSLGFEFSKQWYEVSFIILSSGFKYYPILKTPLNSRKYYFNQTLKPFEFCIFILLSFTIWHLKRRNRKRYSGLQIDPKLYLEYFNKDISRNRMFCSKI